METETTRHFFPRIRFSTLVYGALALLVVLLVVSIIAIYALPQSSAVTERLKNTLPYPAVIIGYRDGITFRTLSLNMEAVKRFYVAQDFATVGLRVDFSTEDGRKRFKVREKEVLNKMIEDRAIKQLAVERGLRVTAEEAAQSVARKLEEYKSGEAVKNDLKRLYGWTLSDFQKKVVIPSLYQEKLSASFMQEVDTVSRSKDAIRQAQEALRTSESFAVVAKKYSEGNTANKGGSLGWFAPEDLALELRDPVATQKIGVPGDVIESALGFHIVLVEEVKKEDKKQLYRLSQIFTRKATFADWLTEKMRSMSIVVLSPEYQWNTEEARVEFKKQELRDFEKDLFENADDGTPFFF